MALTVRELIAEMQEPFQLKLLCGKNDLEYPVTWVHLLEETEATEFFWGNEMVITSGYSTRDEASLLKFIDVLLENHSTGLVVNVGKYLDSVPDSVLKYCEKHHFPVLTMPWKSSITEFVRTGCGMIMRSTLHDEDLAKMIQHIIQSPREAAAYQEQLEERFQPELGFQMLAILLHIPPNWRKALDARSTLRVHSALRGYTFPYLMFRQDNRFILVMNNNDPVTANEIAQKVIEAVTSRIPGVSLEVGVSDPVNSLERLSVCYHAAVSAQRQATLLKLPIINFHDMGFYRLLFSVPDENLLSTYYNELLSPLMEHDRQSSGDYVETLFRYLLADGSLQAVASQMYTHRNTVSYRIAKIKELLETPIERPDEIFSYLLAYHIGIMLGLNPDYESNA